MKKEIWEWKILVQGDVQGVGFRAAAAKQARAYHIYGYARNQTDGTVEIYAQGTLQNLEAFLEALHLQPGLGSIENFKVDRYRPGSFFSSFEIR